MKLFKPDDLRYISAGCYTKIYELTDRKILGVGDCQFKRAATSPDFPRGVLFPKLEYVGEVGVRGEVFQYIADKLHDTETLSSPGYTSRESYLISDLKYIGNGHRLTHKMIEEKVRDREYAKELGRVLTYLEGLGLKLRLDVAYYNYGTSAEGRLQLFDIFTHYKG